MWVESEVGRGSTFHFTVPCVGQNADRPRYLLQASKSSSLGLPAPPLSRALLLIPNEVTARALLSSLEAWSIDSLWARTLADGLELVRTEPRGTLQAVIIDHRVLYSDEQPQQEIDADDDGTGDAANVFAPVYSDASLEELRQALQLPFAGATAAESDGLGQAVRVIALVPVTLQQRLRFAFPISVVCISTPVKPRQLFAALSGQEHKSPFPSPQLPSRRLPRDPPVPAAPSSRARAASPRSAVSASSPKVEGPATTVARSVSLGDHMSGGREQPGLASFAAGHPLSTIVVVEDNKVNQKLLERMLLKLGYGDAQILTADNGQISVDLVKAHAPQSTTPLLIFMVSRTPPLSLALCWGFATDGCALGVLRVRIGCADARHGRAGGDASAPRAAGFGWRAAAVHHCVDGKCHAGRQRRLHGERDGRLHEQTRHYRSTQGRSQHGLHAHGGPTSNTEHTIDHYPRIDQVELSRYGGFAPKPLRFKPLISPRSHTVLTWRTAIKEAV